MSTDNRSPASSTAEISEEASRNTLALNPLVGIQGQDLAESARILFKAVMNEPKVATEQWAAREITGCDDFSMRGSCSGGTLPAAVTP